MRREAFVRGRAGARLLVANQSARRHVPIEAPPRR